MDTLHKGDNDDDDDGDDDDDNNNNNNNLNLARNKCGRVYVLVHSYVISTFYVGVWVLFFFPGQGTQKQQPPPPRRAAAAFSSGDAQ
jgi:hypothetical protein